MRTGVQLVGTGELKVIPWTMVSAVTGESSLIAKYLRWTVLINFEQTMDAAFLSHAGSTTFIYDSEELFWLSKQGKPF